jgi:hypothetical protein
MAKLRIGMKVIVEPLEGEIIAIEPPNAIVKVIDPETGRPLTLYINEEHIIGAKS